MNSREISKYKLNVVDHLLNDSELVKLVDNLNEFKYPEDMIYERIFPYSNIPDVQQEVKTFVTVTIDIPTINQQNDLFRDATLTIRVISHKGLMRVDGKNGTRIDLISERVDELLNESYDFGIGYVKLSYNVEDAMGKDYFYRELKFKTDNLNSKRYGS